MARALVPTLAAGLVGCGSSAFGDPEAVADWANSASAVAVYAHAHQVISFADGQGPFTDPACPMTTDDGTTATVRGPCTDAMGRRWDGSATVVRDASGARVITFAGLASAGTAQELAPLAGSVVFDRIGADEHRFTVDLEQDGGVDVTIDYVGTVRGGYAGPTVWNGAGTVSRDGIAPATGTVRASTVDERLDRDVCSNQAVSGATTLVMDDETAVITYDGATDCDDQRSAAFTYNGEPQGKITGVVCAMSGGSAGGAPMPFALVAGAALTLARRRTRKVPESAVA